MTKRTRTILPFLLLPVWIAAYMIIAPFADLMTWTVLGLAKKSTIGEASWFFIFEAPKVLLLLTLIVFIIGVIRTWFSPERARTLLGGKRQFRGNVLASLLGIVTPFCSCSAVPLFIGFVEAGVPLGVTLSFLVSAPMINEVAVVLLFSLFGWATALIYISTGLTVAIISGFIIGKLKLEKYVEEWVYERKSRPIANVGRKEDFGSRIDAGYRAVREIVGKVWLYVLLGIAVGSVIHGWVPENFMAGIMGEAAWWSVPLAVVIGVPMYSNAAGILPVIQALISKGASLGTALAFMMAVIGLSLPEAIILKKVLKVPLILTFAGIVAIGIIITGYLFNFIY